MNNILVTGGCGFIGTNFIRYLFESSDYEGRVVNVDKLTYAGNPSNLIDIEKRFHDRYVFIKADICDSKTLLKTFKDFQIDTICHFAAESHVDRSIDSPGDFINSNILGTYKMLELCRKHRDIIRLFHHVSTDEVFGSLGKNGKFTEETPYQPNSPYSASKAASDHLVRAYYKTYDIPVTISNCSNNYGPYQFPEKLIPLIILYAHVGKELPVYGDGMHVRDWLYVEDHCRAIWRIMNAGEKGETYNIGGNNEMPNIAVVKTICDLLDEIDAMPSGKKRSDLIKFVKDRPGHDRRYAIDSTKIKNELNWQPTETFESGIRKTVEWYIEHAEWVKNVQSGEYRRWMRHHYK